MHSTKLGVHNSTPSKGSGTRDWGEALKAQVSGVKKWPKCPWPPLPPHCLHALSRHLWPHGEFPEIRRQKRQDSGLIYRCFCTIHRHCLKVEVTTLQLFPWTSLKDIGKGTKWQVTELRLQLSWVFTLLLMYLYVYIKQISLFSPLSYPLIQHLMYWLCITVFKLQNIKESFNCHLRTLNPLNMFSVVHGRVELC